ncbi:MAG: TlpA family protein disulfide reductase [Pirellulales bacterium]
MFALLAVAAGCSQTPRAASQPATAETSSSPDRVEPTLVDLTLVDRAAFDAVLSRTKGKVILVDGWATWCGPCVEQLPHSLALAKEHGDDGLEVVTLNFDDPDSAESAVAILKKSGAPAANVTNLQTKFGGSTESMDAFEITSGALPHYKLYDRQGKLRQTFELDPSAKEQFTPADIDRAVAELLAEPAPAPLRRRPR